MRHHILVGYDVANYVGIIIGTSFGGISIEHNTSIIGSDLPF